MPKYDATVGGMSIERAVRRVQAALPSRCWGGAYPDLRDYLHGLVDAETIQYWKSKNIAVQVEGA